MFSVQSLSITTDGVVDFNDSDDDNVDDGHGNDDDDEYYRKMSYEMYISSCISSVYLCVLLYH